jgi:hypothetical protein
LREPPPQAGEVPRLRVADDLQLDTGRCKAGNPGVEEALEAFALGQPVEASDDDRASRRVGSDGTMRNPRTIVARRQESEVTLPALVAGASASQSSGASAVTKSASASSRRSRVAVFAQSSNFTSRLRPWEASAMRRAAVASQL